MRLAREFGVEEWRAPVRTSGSGAVVEALGRGMRAGLAVLHAWMRWLDKQIEVERSDDAVCQDAPLRVEPMPGAFLLSAEEDAWWLCVAIDGCTAVVFLYCFFFTEYL